MNIETKVLRIGGLTKGDTWIVMRSNLQPDEIVTSTSMISPRGRIASGEVPENVETVIVALPSGVDPDTCMVRVSGPGRVPIEVICKLRSVDGICYVPYLIDPEEDS